MADRAVRLLSRAGTVTATCPMESDPWGYDSENRFLNVGVNLLTELSPEQLHEAPRAIESELDPGGSHRTADGGYADRRIDLDLIAYGNEVVNTANLCVPHPRMQLREFVLLPMSKLMPGWVHPVLGESVENLLSHLQNKTTNTSVNIKE